MNDEDDQSESPPDWYIEDGLVVFTESYHLKRGWCCSSDCRHCPFKGETKDAVELQEQKETKGGQDK